jgi:multisubunit Na+/H+ antiporter MnhE subunit
VSRELILGLIIGALIVYAYGNFVSKNKPI